VEARGARLPLLQNLDKLVTAYDPEDTAAAPMRSDRESMVVCLP
jgi:hypothetical protein